MNPQGRQATVVLVALSLCGACKRTDAPKPAANSADTSASTLAKTSAAPSIGSSGASADLRVVYARGAVRRFGGSLKKELMAGMAEGGPAHAVGICQSAAPKVAERLELKEGWSVRRTSLKVRNPKNAPDAWEREILRRFAADVASGKAAHSLETHTVVEHEGKRVFRYMKAIPTGAVCLNCHGDLNSELATKIDKLYPEDRARGFAVGDLRGAFSVRKEL